LRLSSIPTVWTGRLVFVWASSASSRNLHNMKPDHFAMLLYTVGSTCREATVSARSEPSPLLPPARHPTSAVGVALITTGNPPHTHAHTSFMPTAYSLPVFFWTVVQSVSKRLTLFFARGFLYQDGSGTFFLNVGSYKTHIAPHPKRQHSS
jgi:hypothetical protein